jgi:hypothetical protein
VIPLPYVGEIKRAHHMAGSSRFFRRYFLGHQVHDNPPLRYANRQYHQPSLIDGWQKVRGGFNASMRTGSIGSRPAGGKPHSD